MSFIVAMPVQSAKIVERVVSPVTVNVVDLDDIFTAKVQSAPTAAAILPMQECTHLAVVGGVLGQALAPVAQVAIVGTRAPFHLHVSFYFGHTVPPDFAVFWCFEDQLAVFVTAPVFLDRIVTTLAVVAHERPAHELLEERYIAPHEHLGGDHRSVVGRPASDDGIEHLDHLHLRSRAQRFDALLDRPHVALDGLTARLDDSLEAKRLPLRVLPAVGFAHAVLTDGEPQEIEANVALIGGKRMGDPGFPGMQRQPDVQQEAFYFPRCFLQHRPIRVEKDKVIRIADDEHLFPSLPDLSDFRLQAVQGDVGQQG